MLVYVHVHKIFLNLTNGAATALLCLQNYSNFTLFECRHSVRKSNQSADETDQFIMLGDNVYISDMLNDFKVSNESSDVSPVV
jgi:hypothetical protein